MAMAPGVAQALCPSCGAVNQMNMPTAQVMTDALKILGPQKGILMRQKLDLAEAFVAWQWRNKYKVANLPTTEPEEWTDDAFKSQLKKGHLLTLKEESGCCMRQCCRPRHSFKIKVKGGDDSNADGQTMGEFDRPFQCSMICCFWLICPQVLTATANGKETGKVIHHWPCINNIFLCHRYWRVVDGSGKDVYMIYDNSCCNSNLFAPNCCCKVHTIDIMTPDMTTKVGSIKNIWPGCNLRGCIATADNYVMTFPENASPEDKFNLLGALVLIEYMLFEKQPNQDAAIGL